VDRTDLAELLAHRLDGYQAHTVVILGEGQENVAYEVNSEIVVRISKQADPAAVVDREARLLEIVGRVSTLPIPRPLFAADGVLAYRKLIGTPLLDLPTDRRRRHAVRIGGVLGGFLAEIQSIAVDLVTDLVPADNDPLAEWMADARQSFAEAEHHLPARHRSQVETFLNTDPAAEPLPELVFSHNDLGIEHVLVDAAGAAVTGIIDFSDAALVDPAYDFALILRDLGPGAFDAAAQTAQKTGDRDFQARALLYARCSVLEDLQYGLATDHPAYVDKSLVSLDWLFAG
jgi:aminoglycoside phosphotransferase (APT) family kinase protein